MKKKSTIRTPQTILCSVIVALLIPAMYICSHIINTELVLYIKQTLKEISVQNVKFINCKVSDDILLLEEISDRITNDDSFDSVLAGLKSAAEFYGYKRVGIVYRDGSIYTSDNVDIDIMNERHIIRAFSGESVVSDVFPDFADNKNIFVFAVPVYDKTGVKIDAVYFATSDMDTFRTHLAVSGLGGSEYAYIVKADGTTVVDSAHESAYPNMRNVFDAMGKVGNNREVIDTMRRDMSAGREKCLEFQNNGETRYIDYAPLGINDWYILSVVSAEVVDGARLRIMIVTYTVFALMTVIALIFVAAMIRSEKVKQEQLKRILYVDELTGGISFTKFCLDAQELLENRTDKTLKAACAMTDLENFRLINNLYGMAEGDKTIVNSYKVFKNVIGENDLLTRLTADRFYALLFFKDTEELEAKLNHFIDDLRTSADVSESEYILKPSIGVYIIDKPGEDMKTITNNATIAHDTIGSKGDRIVFYNEAQRDRLRENKRLEDKMELAHKNHEFIPFYQPKYNALTGKICGAEALVRWKNADGSITPPGQFIPLAESNGFIRVLDRDILGAVCAFQRKVLDSGANCVPISVNVSKQLMYEHNFATDYIETVKKYNLSPDLIEIEITESVLFDDYSEFRNIINMLRESGFKILMDDFGTGYSSLMMLSSVPIDNLKLDKSFVDSFEEEKGRKIIISVIDLAKSLSLPLTAEGVETRSQFDFLKSLGCDVIQGFYFSKPVPEDVFMEMLVEQQKAG